MIFIIDDFLNNPYEIRNHALSDNLNYIEDYNHLIPGIRSYGEDSISNIVLRKINLLTGENLQTKVSGFHLTTANDCCGNIHVDAKCLYAAVLYLNLNPPKNSGTRIFNSGYNYNWIGEEEFINKTKKFRSSKNNYLSRLKYRFHMKRYEKQFGIGMDVENKFNRLVVYKSPIAHKALNCFGRDRNDSRLIFFGFYY